VPNDLPSTPYVPAHFDWLQHLAERFSSFVDTLSLQFSTVLGAWSRQPLLFGITPASGLVPLGEVLIRFNQPWLSLSLRAWFSPASG